MSKRSGGKNRVCFPCRLKYPGKFTSDAKNTNITDVCSECSGHLTSIPDSIRVPKRHQVKLWKKLQADIEDGTVETPAGSYNQLRRHYSQYPEHEVIDRKLRNRANRREKREAAEALESAYPGIIEDFLERYRFLPRYEFDTNLIWREIIDKRDDLTIVDVFDMSWLDSERLQDRIYALQWHVEFGGLITEEEKEAWYTMPRAANE